MFAFAVLLLPSLALAQLLRNGDCDRHFERYATDLMANRFWATSMFDATAKLQAGILWGNLAHLGFFDQCLDVSAETPDGRIEGKYCLGNAKTSVAFTDAWEENRSLDFSWGVCVPHLCEAEDVGPRLLQVLSGFIDTSNLTLSFDADLCQTRDDVYPPLSTAAIVTLGILGTLLLIVVTATAVDILKSNLRSSTCSILVKSFSAAANGRKIFSYTQNREQMLCLNGLKVLSIFWIILLHEYSIITAGPIENLRDLERWKNSPIRGYERSGSLAVETFFVISGLLLSYNHLKKTEGGKRFNLLHFYLHRIIRILPALAGVVLVSGTLLRFFGSGPYWNYLVKYFHTPCEKFWWSSILFVHNYLDLGAMCVGHAWYLDVDMQLFLLSPLLLLPLKKYKKATVSFTVLLILISIAGSFALAWTNELVAMSDDTYGDQQMLQTTYYLKTHARAPAWLVGILCGILMHDLKYKPPKLSRVQVVCLWVLSIAVLLTCSFGGYHTLRGDDYRRFDNAMYIALNRPAFSVALCWVIVGSVFGYGGIINDFLSLPVLQVISKLVYSMYLIHVTMMYVIVYSSKTSLRFSNITLMHKFWGDCFFGMFLAVIWVLIFEYPPAGLEKLIF